jgi:hypothetical protein
MDDSRPSIKEKGVARTRPRLLRRRSRISRKKRRAVDSHALRFASDRKRGGPPSVDARGSSVLPSERFEQCGHLLTYSID